MPTVELINTGSELLLGCIPNTHAAYLAQKLSSLDLEITRQVTVGDDPLMIRLTFANAIARADLILATGGLGPTQDDITRDVVAELCGRKLRFDGEVMAAIEARFAGRKFPEGIRVQAQVPEGAKVLPNRHGTAPGLVLTHDGKLIVLLPGPPRELYPMFEQQVLPMLREKFPPAEPREVRSLRVALMGESLIEEKVLAAVHGLEGLQLGYCARMGEVDVRILARGKDAKARAEEAERRVRNVLGDAVFGTADDRLEEVVLRLLIARKQTLAVAESCTGGAIANRLTNISGSSQAFLGAVVCYSNAAKIAPLGVEEQVLVSQGAVSEPVARQLAEGARKCLRADFGIGVTGIAGPASGSVEKPVGTVFLAVASPRRTLCQHRVFAFDRETFKFIASQTALDLLRRELCDSSSP